MEHLSLFWESRLPLHSDWWCLETLPSRSESLHWGESSCCDAATWAAAAAGSVQTKHCAAARCACWHVGWWGDTAAPERTPPWTAWRTGCKGRDWERSWGRRRCRPRGGAWRFCAGRKGSSRTWKQLPSWNERSGWGASTPSKIQRWDL